MAQRASAAPTAVSFSALRHRDYRTYLALTCVSMIGDNIEHIISYWVIFQQFHSPALAGFAVISHWLPFLLFSFYAGSLADRFDCRKLIQISEGLLVIASLAWGLLFLTGSLQVWHAVVILCIHGMAGVLAAPADQLIIYDVVGPEHLQSAVRLGASGRQLSILLGPAVGGGLMYFLGPAGGLLVNVLLYLPLTVMLAILPYTGHTRETARTGRVSGLGLREAGRVFREVQGDRRIQSMILLSGASSLFVGLAFQAQMPEYAHHFGADESGFRYSALLAANAAGAVAGAILLESSGFLQPKTRTAILSAILWSLVIGVFPAAPNYETGLALLILAGLLHITFLSMAQTLVQLLAPINLRGRVLGLYNMASFGLRVGSGMSVGLLGSVVGIYWSLAASAGAFLLTAFGLLFFDRGAGRRAG